MLRSKAFALMLLLVTIASIALTGVGMEWKEVRDVIVFDSLANEKYTEAMQVVLNEYNMHAMYLTKHQMYSFSIEILPLLEEGGELHERLGWLLEQDYERKQIIGDDLYPPDIEHVKETWRFRKSTENSFGIFSFVGIVLIGFLFGREFMNRTLSFPIAIGTSRTGIVMGKLSAYLILTMALSVIQQIAIMAVYNPTVLALGFGYMVRCMATCSFIHIGLCFMPLIFVFMFRDIAKSMSIYFLFNVLFLSNKRIVGINIMEPYLSSALWSKVLSVEALLSMFLMTMTIVVVSWVGSVILLKRAELK
jgi:hypothetical protein